MQSEEVFNLANTVSFSTIKCTNCNSTWLAPGLLDGDRYECKSCGFSIVVEGNALGESQGSADAGTSALRRMMKTTASVEKGETV
jgi:hypothetical protein